MIGIGLFIVICLGWWKFVEFCTFVYERLRIVRPTNRKKTVWKYGTGEEIPFDAEYLCTQVETLEEKVVTGTITKNVFVWHYYEILFPGPETK